MQFKFSRVDIEKTRVGWPTADFTPALVLPRAQMGNKVWHIVDKPVMVSAGVIPSWAIAIGDEYVRIPLFEYELPANADTALAFMLQFGLLCGQVNNVQIAHIVTGHPVELVYNPDGTIAQMLGWVGLALAFGG